MSVASHIAARRTPICRRRRAGTRSRSCSGSPTLLPFWLFPDYLVLASQIAITALFALSLDLILGYAGIVSLGHAAFFGLGAYTAGLDLQGRLGRADHRPAPRRAWSPASSATRRASSSRASAISR